MSTPKLIRVPIVPAHVVNAHLIVGDGGAILVDAGLPRSAPAIERALQGAGLSWSSLKLIVVTHAHVDHAGAAASAHRRSGAPIVAHQDELTFLRGETPMTFCPTRWTGRMFVRAPLIHERYRPVEPEIVLSGSEKLDLAKFGVDGAVVPTPGHTPGSLSVMLASGDALVGDLVASGIGLGGVARLGHAIRPPFEDDPPRVADALEGLIASGARRFYLGHGGPLDAREVARHAAWLRTAPRGTPHPQRPARAALTEGRAPQ